MAIVIAFRSTLANRSQFAANFCRQRLIEHFGRRQF